MPTNNAAVINWMRLTVRVLQPMSLSTASMMGVDAWEAHEVYRRRPYGGRRGLSKRSGWGRHQVSAQRPTAPILLSLAGLRTEKI
jgi:hypothetical protein